ncbi:hypothetical protein BX600DRAFT_501477 [Xylariales sp. PMI_506]|nr:hypothetical protein BX600DRAFT_501477 [Xylariales sp. PMI_506]
MARKGNLKVRTGCLTCKIRKVKCDETKPACSRCTSTGRKCDGYAVGEASVSSASIQLRLEGGTSNHAQQEHPRKLAPRTLEAAYDPYLRSVPVLAATTLTPRESRYFDVFRHCIAPRYPDQEFWQRVVLRESMRDDSVRFCVVALGAEWQALVHEQQWRRGRRSTLDRTGKKSLALTADHREAAKYYAQSLANFRVRLAREQAAMSPRTIFIATYLFFVFEQIQGNAKNADALLLNGMMILRKHLSIFQENPTLDSQCAAALDDGGMDFAESTLIRIAAINTTGVGFQSGLASFGRELAQRIISSPVPDPSTPLEKILHMWDVFVSRCGLWTFRTSPSSIDPDDIETFAAIMDTQKHVVYKYTLWRELFITKLKYETSEMRRDVLAAVWPCLRMSQMCMDCFFDPTELSWDDYLDECEITVAEVEALPKAAAGDDSSGEAINFAKCLYSLYVIAQKCRHKQVRQRALKLLRQVANRGAAWDIRAFIMSAEVHVAAEEAGRDKMGHIPASKRFGWTSYSWNDDRTEMVLILKGVVPDEAGVLAYQELHVRPEDFDLI